MVPGDAVAGIPWDEEMGMGAGGQEEGGMGTPWPAWGSGLWGARRVTTLVMAPAVRHCQLALGGCGFRCRRRRLAMK